MSQQARFPDFPRAWRGLEPTAVYAYLVQREHEMARLQREAEEREQALQERIAALEAELAPLRREVQQCREQESAIQRALVRAEHEAEQIRAEAVAEAAETERAARALLAELVREGERAVDELSAELTRQLAIVRSSAEELRAAAERAEQALATTRGRLGGISGQRSNGRPSGVAGSGTASPG